MSKPCIKRDCMPQVDEADYTDMLLWLGTKDVLATKLSIPPSWLSIRQCLDECHPARREELLVKPLLCSMELAVLDGNNRLLRHLLEGHPIVDVYISSTGTSMRLRSFCTLTLGPTALRMGLSRIGSRQ